MGSLPAILKFGVTGLSAIVFILAYRLMNQVLTRDDPKPAHVHTARFFMWASLLFCILSAASSFAEGYWLKKRTAADSADAVRREFIASQALRAIEGHLDQMTGRAGGRRSGKGTIYDGSVDTTGFGPLPDSAELNTRMLRKAVFLSFGDFLAQKDVLEEALAMLRAERKDFAGAVDVVVDEYDELRALKLRWLKDEVLPALRTDAATLTMEQRNPQASVPLPPAVRVLKPNDAAFSAVPMHDIPRLEQEVELLTQQRRRPSS